MTSRHQSAVDLAVEGLLESPVVADGTEIVYLGLGSNQGDSIAAFAGALEELEAILRNLTISPLYRSAAVVREGGFPDRQDDYWNLVARGLSGYPTSDHPRQQPPHNEEGPARLLRFTQALEAAEGRQRAAPTVAQRDAPRSLDIDLLLFGRRQLRNAWLEIPHPRLRQRRFVLAPLADLAPQLQLPPDGVTAEALLAMLPQGHGDWVRREPTPPALRRWMIATT